MAWTKNKVVLPDGTLLLLRWNEKNPPEITGMVEQEHSIERPPDYVAGYFNAVLATRVPPKLKGKAKNLKRA